MTWFERLTGIEETTPDEVRARLRVDDGRLYSSANDRSWAYGPFSTPSLGELRALVTGQVAERAAGDAADGGKPDASGEGDIAIPCREVVGDVTRLHADPANAGALFQVASQFNFLEMTSPSVTPEQGVGIYQYDRTQGPACAIACGAGTIYRNYFVPVDGRPGQAEDRQLDGLAEIGAVLGNDPDADGSGRLWTMRNGCALATEDGLKEIQSQLAGLEAAARNELMSHLRIGVQRDSEVTLPGAGYRVTQAYCSALPVAYSRQPAERWEPFARLILEAAYEATLLLGLSRVLAQPTSQSEEEIGSASVVETRDDGAAPELERRRSGAHRVFLTLLGGGAFGNETEWIADAIIRAVETVRSMVDGVPVDSATALDVAIVSYGASKPVVRDILERLG